MNASELRSLIEEGLASGTVAVLVDTTHDAWQELASPVGPPCLIELAGDEDRLRVSVSSDVAFAVRASSPEGEARSVFVPWDGVFCVAVRETGKVMLRQAAIPASIGGPQELHTLLVSLRLAAPGLEQVSQWRLQPSRELLAADSDRSRFVPDKPIALGRLLRTPGACVAMIVDGAPAPAVLGHEAPFLNLTFDHEHVQWKIRAPDGTIHGPLTVPWSRVGAMKEMRTGAGFYWPADLPQSLREDQAARDPAWWTLVQDEVGIPVEPHPVPAISVLVAAPEEDPRAAVERCRALGGGVLLVNALADGVQLPADLAERAVVAVPLDMPGVTVPFEAREDGLRTGVPDTRGVVQPCTLPWESVFLAATNRGPANVQRWPDRYPAIIHTMIEARDAMSRGEAPVSKDPTVELDTSPEPGADGLGVGVDTETGLVLLGLRQPMGQDAGGETVFFELQFLLDRPGGEVDPAS